MIVRKLMLGVLVILMATSCATPQPAQSATVGAVQPTATRARAARPTATATAQPTATATLPPTVEPTGTATVAPTATSSPAPTATPSTLAGAALSSVPMAAPANAEALQPQPAPEQPVTAGLLLAIDPNKYPAPTLLTPDNNATYHVAQPVVHMAWSAAPTDLMAFGQTPGCVSDDTNFRRAYESYQLIIHSLDGTRPDQVQWTADGTGFDLNLTTVPQGRYSWRVNIVTLCESYVVGERNNTLPLGKKRYDDPAYHHGTLQTTYMAAVSPTSETRIINWIP